MWLVLISLTDHEEQADACKWCDAAMIVNKPIALLLDTEGPRGSSWPS